MRILRAGAILLLASMPALGRPEAGGAGLDRIPREKVLAAAREIDRLIEADLAANQLQPNPALDDEGFVRRIYLDLAGRIPTEKEAVEFLASASTDRREALIDRLLDSPAYASHLFNWLADLLRVKSRLTNNVSGEPYIHFIKESLATNKPWDAFVHELLTASGPAHQRGHGATGYYLRDRGMPEDNMSNTITLFLGTRLECAQCHNHPFDTWTQLQYHEMVAFTGGLKYTDDSFPRTPEGQRLKALGDTFKSEKGKERSLESRAFGNLTQTLQYGISGSGTGLYRLPKDYQYNDAKPNDPVKAKAMFGNEAKLDIEIPVEKSKDAKKPDPKGKKAPPIKAVDAHSREAYAAWLTAPENPRFSTVIANRLWKRFFGAGVIEPVDNLRKDTKPVNPALMKHLESTMVGMGFDLKQYIRVLVNSRTYQREACRKDAGEEAAFRFPGPMLRRMSAEQLWDSVVTLVVPDLDATLLESGEAAEPVYESYERLTNLTPEQAKAAVELEVLRQKDPAKYRDLRQKQAEEAKAALKDNAELDKKVAGLREAQKAARKKGDDAEARRLREEIQDLEKNASPLLMPDMKAVYKKGGDGRGGLLRASDLPQPANAGHFLREFGQSDREQIESSHRQSSAPQALTLLNGFVDKTILPNTKAVIRTSVAAASTPADKVRTLFRGVLSREPSPAERGIWEGHVQRRGDAAVKDLLWTLVNTHEFMFIR